MIIFTQSHGEQIGNKDKRDKRCAIRTLDSEMRFETRSDASGDRNEQDKEMGMKILTEILTKILTRIPTRRRGKNEEVRMKIENEDESPRKESKSI